MVWERERGAEADCTDAEPRHGLCSCDRLSPFDHPTSSLLPSRLLHLIMSIPVLVRAWTSVVLPDSRTAQDSHHISTLSPISSLILPGPDEPKANSTKAKAHLFARSSTREAQHDPNTISDRSADVQAREIERSVTLAMDCVSLLRPEPGSDSLGAYLRLTHFVQTSFAAKRLTASVLPGFTEPR
jgi:hypothetical protein